MPYRKKATDEQVIEAYERLGSIWKAGKELGMCGQAVHERLRNLGVDVSQNVFTSEDERYLADRYVTYRDAGMLQVLADEMGRTKQFICRKAGTMGLTDKHGQKRYFSRWKDMPECVMKPIWEQFKRSRKNVSEFCASRHYNVQSFHDAMTHWFPEEYDDVVGSKKPKRTQYARGRDLEYSVRDDMRRHGYLALRAPASKSPADVYCVKTGELVFIQCKLHGALYKDEWNKFFLFCDSVNATPIMARRPDVGRGIEYFKLLDFKDHSRRRSPMEPWEPTDGEEITWEEAK